MISIYKKFIRKNENVVNLINNEFKNNIVIYNGIIISIYGNLENYIDSIFNKLLEIYFKSSTRSLPEKLISKYRKNFGDYLNNPQRYGIDIPEIDLIGDYLSILESNYQNIKSKEFFLRHSGNLKADKILQLMMDFDIDDPLHKILNESVFKNFYIDVVGLDDSDFNTKKNRKSYDLFKYIDEIVEQRNFVAHGSDDYNRINVKDIICYNIQFINCFSKSILKVLLKKVVLYFEDNNFINIKLLRIIDNRILCLHVSKVLISKHDYIVYKIKNRMFASEIIRIEINNKEAPCVNNDECDIGIEVDDRVNFDEDFELINIIHAN